MCEGEKLSSVIGEPETPGADEADAEASSCRSRNSPADLGPPEGRGGWVEGAGAARAAREGTRPWSTGAMMWQREAARGEILKEDSGGDAGQGSSFTL